MKMTREEWHKIKDEIEQVKQERKESCIKKCLSKIKISVTFMILFSLILTPLISAQEPPPLLPQLTWTVHPSRSIIWIGEELVVMVNGTGNTSYTLEIRPYGANNTVLNATFKDFGTTDLNGTDFIIVHDTDTEEPGNYRIQVLVNQMVVGFADLRVDYSFERWVEIKFNRQELFNTWTNATDQEGFERDNIIVKRLLEAEFMNKIMFVFVLIVVTLSIPAWLDIYRRNCETKNKRSKFLDALSGVEEDRTMYYGGLTIGKYPVRMYGGANSCKDKKNNSHIQKDCPHCQLDLYADEMGFSNMTHDEIMRIARGEKRVKKVIAKAPGYFARKALAKSYKKSQKKPKDERKPEKVKNKEKKVEP